MIFRDYFRWKLPDLKVNFTLPLTFWRYVTFACPDPWGGDGVVFADPAHARTFFLNTNLPRHYCWTR